MAQKSSLKDFLLLLKRWGQQSVLSRLLALVIHVKAHGFCFFPPSSLSAPSPLAPKKSETAGNNKFILLSKLWFPEN